MRADSRRARRALPTQAERVGRFARRAGWWGLDYAYVRIVSVYGSFDPHVPAGSRLAGAMANIELATPGHFRVLADPRLPEVVRDAVSRLGLR